MSDILPFYKGPIRVAWINDTGWMRAGDLGTSKNMIAALEPVANTVEIKGSLWDLDKALILEKTESSYSLVKSEKEIHAAADLKTWRENTASILRRTPHETAPTVFVSTAQFTLRPLLRALRTTVDGPTLWINVFSDTFGYTNQHPEILNGGLITAALPHYKPWDFTEPGHSWITIPYLPERRNLPSQETARTALEKRHGIALKRPIMTVLIGRETAPQPIIDAARALGADLLVTTSPRTELSEKQRKTWQESTRIFYEFGKSEQPNPYEEFIAAGNYIATGADSFSMPSDVLALGKPLALFGASTDNMALIERGFATRIEGAATVWQVPPPHETPGTIINRTVRTELAKLCPR